MGDTAIISTRIGWCGAYTDERIALMNSHCGTLNGITSTFYVMEHLTFFRLVLRKLQFITGVPCVNNHDERMI